MEISKDKIGYIISNAFLFSDKASKLRNKLLRDERLHKVINFGDIKIFDAGISTCIIIFQKNEKNKKKNIIQAMFLKQKKLDTKEIISYINDEKNLFNVRFEEDKVFALTDEKESNVNEKIDKNAKKLSDILFVGKGMETAANEVFCFDALPKFIPKKYLKRRMSGESIKRYYKRPDENYMLYFEFENDFEKLPSSIKQHLLNNKKALLERATVKNEGRAWWRYSRPMHKEMYDKCKIWCSYRAKDNEFVLDETNDFIGLSNTTVIFDTNPEYNIKYILAIINSKLINYRYKSIAKMTGNGVYEYVPNAVGRIPIIYTNKETQKQFAILVDKMIQAMKNIYNATSDKEKKNAQDVVDAIDKEINTKVYELYGLTKEEIEEVEKQSI